MPEVLTTKLLTELAGLFVVATIMESALATLFNWRLYREFFSGRAVKTLIMITFGYAVVKAFNYDVFSRIIGFAGGAGESGLLSEILSALALAGGSAAVSELFRTLGLRPPVERADVKPQPPPDKAWASVRIVRHRAVGDVNIHFDLVPTSAPEQQDLPALAGVVRKKTCGERMKDVFFADPMRLPAYGGRTLDTDKVYRILAKGHRQADNPGDPDVAFTEEIYFGRFAGRAVVDFVHRI